MALPRVSLPRPVSATSWFSTLIQRFFGGRRQEPYRRPTSQWNLLQLEERSLLSATPVPTEAVHAAALKISLAPPVPAVEASTANLQVADSAAVSEPAALTQTNTQVRREVVFVDTSLANHQQLIQDLQAQSTSTRSLDVYQLNRAEDGAQQISDILAGYEQVDAVHILSHGTDGAVKLGSEWITEDRLPDFAAEIRSWSESLSDDADLLFYGCDLAESDAGQRLLRSIGDLTGAEVAASTDTTGSASRGGDWQLEFTTAPLATASLAAPAWDGSLQVYLVTNTNGSGVGSLRQAILDANANPGLDTIEFSIAASDPGHVYYRNDGIAGSLSVIASTSAATDAAITDFDPDYPGGIGFSWWSIKLGGAGLPVITDSVIIDATTQRPSASRPVIELDGSLVPTVANGLHIQAGSSTVRGLVVNRFVDAGILLETNGGNTIQGNYIGTDITGSIALPNGTGIEVRSNSNLIGGASAGQGNVFSGNTGPGVYINGSSFNSILGNRIGVAATGSNALGNGMSGVGLHNGAANNAIGGIGAGEGNVIAHNGLGGVVLSSIAGIANPIRGNSIYSNAGLGIDLGYDGVSANDANDADAGPNSTHNFADISSAVITGNTIRIQGSISAVVNQTQTMDFYASSSMDPSGYGEGERFLGTIDVTCDAAGFATFDVTFNVSVLHGEYITSTAANEAGSTSEFSAAVMATKPNEAPVNAVPVSQSINEDTTLVFSAGNANAISISDPDAGARPVQVTLSVTGGTLTLGSTAGLTFIAGDGANDASMQFSGTLASINTALNGLAFAPPANVSGAVTLQITTDDLGNWGTGGALSDTDTVAITIQPVNDAPAALNDAYSVNEGDTLNASTSVLANDTDIEGNLLSANLVTGPANGSLTLNANGTFTYTPNAHFNGTDSFTYRASDGFSTSNLATVTITVTSVNDAPVATPDSYTTSEDTALNVAASGVLANDTDADGNPLTAQLVSGPSHGTLTLNANGSFTYTPDANYHGTDSFTYGAGDGSLTSNVATVTITINPVNDVPVAGHDAFSTSEDTPLTINSPGVLANDSDLDGTPLTATLVSGPTHGSLTWNANGSFVYAPNANFHGTDTFTYRASDGSANSNLATVTLTVHPVNDAPVAANDTYAVNEDAPLTISAAGVLANDSDIEANALTALLVSGPAHGSLTLNADGSFTYTANANFNGTDSFTYRANDGTADSNVATVTITVNPVNDVPVALNDSYAINEDAALIVPAAGVLGNDTDIDGNALSASLVSGPAHGSLTFNADGSFTYTPDANYNGTDSFTYRANDGTTTSNVATVTINVNPVNDAPVAANDSFSTNEDTPLIVPVMGVLANDSDVDGNTLTTALVSGPTHGSLTLNTDGSFTYTPDANYHGTDSFSYRARDGALDSGVATVTITVQAVNDAPVAGNDTYSVNEDTPLVIGAAGVLANDSDLDGNALTAVVVSGPTNGSLTLNADGSFTYTANANFNGTDSFTYRAHDGATNSNVATVTITVNPVNDAPAAGNDSYTVNEDTTLVISATGVLGNDSDIDGNALSASLVSGPAHGSLTLNADGSFTYTPDANFNGTDSFSYRARDGAADSNVATVTITVNPVNDAPVAGNDAYSVNEDTPLIVGPAGVLANDSDLDGNALTAVLVSGPAHGNLTLNIDGSLTYTPDANFNGTDSFTYQANDGAAGSNPATVTITINPVNDAPVAASDAFSVDEDNTLTISVPGVLGNDADIDGNPLTAALVSGPSSGTLTLNADGSFTYTPDANFNGIDSFTYQANDGTADSNVTVVTITVNPVNDAPVAANDSFSTNEDTPLLVTPAGILANDSDVDGDLLSASLVSGPAHGSLTLNADGSFTYTPDANFNGTDSFSYRARDGAADSNVATVTITVNPVNDAPVAGNDAYATDEDTTLVVHGVLANDGDVDGDTLGAALVAGPTHGALTLNMDGSFTYTPDANFNGTDSFTYRASDGNLNSNIATVTITVNPVNDAPVAAGEGYVTDEDTTLPVSASGVLGNDSDIDGDVLTPILVEGPSNGTLTLHADGSFNYLAHANFNGADHFTYLVSDGALQSDLATVTITINPVNDTPFGLTMDNNVVNEHASSGTIVARASAGDIDAGDSLRYSLANNAGGRFSIETNTGLLRVANGTLLDHQTSQSHVIVVVATDSQGASTAQAMTVQVRDLATPVVPQSPNKNQATAASDESTDKTGQTQLSTVSLVVNRPREMTAQTGFQVDFFPPSVSSNVTAAPRSLGNASGGERADHGHWIMTFVSVEAPTHQGTSIALADEARDGWTSSTAAEPSTHSHRGSMLVVSAQMDSDLDELSRSFQAQDWSRGMYVSVSTGLSVGYVLLHLRNVYFLAGMLLSRPLWGSMDPQAILDTWSVEEGRFLFAPKDDDEEELEPIIDGSK